MVEDKKTWKQEFAERHYFLNAQQRYNHFTPLPNLILTQVGSQGRTP
jgi:hypothetical protein